MSMSMGEGCLFSQRFPGASGFTALATIVACLGAASVGHAVELDVGNPEVSVHWDNTLKESFMFRVARPTATFINDAATGSRNHDDGDRNFSSGLVSSRTDLLSEFDVTYRHWGVRFSGAAWYDPQYIGSNGNDSKATTNNQIVAYNRFPGPTEQQLGKGAELLDAFAFGETRVGDSMLTFRAGRHSLQWGETLFYGANGIAGGQQPTDVAKLQGVPSSPFKEIIRPVNQVSGLLQINSMVSVGAYYQLEWEPSLLPPVGSYFSTTDFVGRGNQSFLIGTTSLVHGVDQNAKNNGQGGLELRISTADIDYGLYAIQYHEKTAQGYLNVLGYPPFRGGTYQWIYPQNIQAFGASASTTLGELNVAGEMSMRHNMDLASNPKVAFAYLGQSNSGLDNDTRPGYATGNTLHLNVSATATLSPNFIAQEASLMAEVAANRVMEFTNNTERYFATHADRDAVAWRVSYTPTYRQVLPNLDLSIPISWSFSPMGKSGAVGPSFAVDHGGDVSIGIDGTYRELWNFGLRYVRYYGPINTSTDVNGAYTFQQALADRDFISLNVRRTF